MMSKYIYMTFLYLGMALGAYCQSSFQVDVRGKGYFVNTVFHLETADSVYQVALNTGKITSLRLPRVDKPVYGVFVMGQLRIPLCLNNKDFFLDFDPEKGFSGRQFSGPGAKENQYLNDSSLLVWQENWQDSEEKYMTGLQKIRGDAERELLAWDLDPEFVEIERKRLDYHVFARLAFYPMIHKGQYDPAYKPSENLCDKISTLIRDEGSLSKVFTYREAMEQAIFFEVMKENENVSALQLTEAKLNFALKRLEDPVFLDWYVHKTVCSYVETCGTEHLERILPVYERWVNSSRNKKEWETLLAKWDKISEGNEIPDFVYSDINGKQVHFSDLRGKYVYIDIWATWCRPCCEEIPALQELEKKYEKHDICFVSLSCDNNKKAWENKVNKDQLGGTQLFMGNDRRIMDYFKIHGIPRFILLDKTGRVVNAMMTRPSNPETIQLFNKYLGLK